MTTLLRGPSFVILLLSLMASALPGIGQERSPGPGSTTVEASLPSAPEPQLAVRAQSAVPDPPNVAPPAAAVPEAGKYDPVIEPGQAAPRLSAWDKLVYSSRQNVRPVTILPALYSMGYEQLFNTDPKYGTDAGAGAAKFGASMLHSATVRTLGDGVFAAAFRQDPRYYRAAKGSIVRRGLYSAERAFVLRSDDGVDQLNYSGLAGRAAAAVLTLAYYPRPSRNTSVVLRTFGWSVASDIGGNLVLEFLPDLVFKFPRLRKIELP